MNLERLASDPVRTEFGWGAYIQLGESPAAIVPATADNMLLNSMLENKHRVSETIQKRLEQLELSFEKAVPIFFDLISVQGIGHIYTHAYGAWPSE